MTLRDDIASQLRQVVAVSTGFGATWQYRQLTSALDADPAYTALANIEGHQSNRQHSESFDGDGRHVREERCGFRPSDSTTALKQGDELVDPDGNYWAVRGIASSGLGTVKYDLVRVVPLLGEGVQRGGV